MRRRRARWQWLYLAGTGAVVAALFLVTRMSLRLEAAHRTEQAHGRAREQAEAVRRNALWRLDSRVLPLLAREGARPYFEYLAYYPQECGYTRYLSPVSKGDVLVASPLLLVAPAPFRLHFQIDSDQRFSSPQVPLGNQLDLAQATCTAGNLDFPTLDADHAAARLAQVRALVTPASLRAAVVTIEACELATAGAKSDGGDWVARQQQVIDVKRTAVNDANYNNRAAEPLEAPAQVVVGSLVPWWVGGETPELFFVRRVEVGAQELLQGIWCDWPQLRLQLLESIATLLPGADLLPAPEMTANAMEVDPSSLTSIPVRLVAPVGFGGEVLVIDGGWSATHSTLAAAWIAVVGALAVGWWMVRSSVALAQRRDRFASAVTHELRTPLTTFRMYSEMLADGMVTAPEQRQSYLQTLKEQSGRLATLVENVLAYARLEERGAMARRERCTVAKLLASHEPTLRRRAAEAGFECDWKVDPAAAAAVLDTDVDAIGQILFNLFDNACKYGRGEEASRIELIATATAADVEVVVVDHGAGVPAALREVIFEPFERGARNDDARPGVGLGLALARGLARDLGGELELRAVAGAGAVLALRLPRAS